jgi:hypothetical protein
MRTDFWPENLKGADHLKDLGVDVVALIEWIMEKLCG